MLCKDGVTRNWPGMVSNGGPGISNVEMSGCAARGCRERRWVELAQDRVRRWFLPWQC